jgi:UDPglucose--hexose-1-phosphate uridylyltransferase
VSPQRLERPWQGQVEAAEADDLPAYDARCYLCPGNDRANGKRNPAYRGPFAFDNDFPALTETSRRPDDKAGLLVARPESGCCRVICYTEHHHQRLATMGLHDRVAALQAMTKEFAELDARPTIAYVQIFENRGEMMGCSNPHPHAQVWATANLPSEPEKEWRSQQDYWREHGSPLLLDYLDTELAQAERLVAVNEDFAAVVPYWAVWPYEVMLLPRRRLASLTDLAGGEMHSLAKLLGQVLRAYEALFAAAVPYSLGFHPRPSDGEPHPEWQLHAHIYPPLLRSASVRKHLVGFEMFAMAQRDLTPEAAAKRLRDAVSNEDKDD